MRFGRTLPTALAAMALIVGGAVPAAAQNDDDYLGETDEILFIGNQRITWNDRLSGQFQSLATSDEAVSELLTGSFTSGDPSYSLRDHYEMSVTDEGMEDYGALDMIREGDYDVVILQGALFEPTGEAEAEFLEYASLFDEEVRARGGRTVLYMTWPSPLADDEKLAELVGFYREAAAGLGVSVAPVGSAMAKAQAAHPEIDVISLDPRLPAWPGTYLGAAVVYASLFERSPEGLPYRPSFVFETDAAALQEIAWQTVEEWRAGD